jgi:hypothetical protein
MKKLKSILNSLFVIIIVYLFFAFMQMDLNPKNYPLEIRAAEATFFILSPICVNSILKIL